MCVINNVKYHQSASRNNMWNSTRSAGEKSGLTKSGRCERAYKWSHNVSSARPAPISESGASWLRRNNNSSSCIPVKYLRKWRPAPVKSRAFVASEAASCVSALFCIIVNMAKRCSRWPENRSAEKCYDSCNSNISQKSWEMYVCSIQIDILMRRRIIVIVSNNAL